MLTIIGIISVIVILAGLFFTINEKANRLPEKLVARDRGNLDPKQPSHI